MIVRTVCMYVCNGHHSLHRAFVYNLFPAFIHSFTCQEVHYKFQNSGHRQKSNTARKMQQTYEYILKLNAV
jgi:hypothetical protein